MITIPARFAPAEGNGHYFSGQDRLITCNQVRSVLIFKDQLHRSRQAIGY